MKEPRFKVGDRVVCITSHRFGTIAKGSWFGDAYVVDWDAECSEVPVAELLPVPAIEQEVATAAPFGFYSGAVSNSVGFPRKEKA